MARTDLAAAIELLRQAADVDPQLEVPRALAQLLGTEAAVMARTKPDVAVELLRQAVAVSPQSGLLRETLAKLLIERSELEAADAVLEEGLTLDDSSPGLLNLKARLLDRRDQLPQAIDYYRQAARAAPDDKEIFADWIDALVRADRADDALERLDRRLKAFPDNTSAQALKGRVLLEVNRPKEAVQALQKAVELDPNELAVQLDLAETLLRLERYNAAKAAYRSAIENDNRLCDARAYFSILLIDIAEYGEAAKHVHDAIGILEKEVRNRETQTRLGWLYSTLAWAWRCSGEVPIGELEAALHTALRYRREDPWTRKDLGSLYLRTGRQKQGEAVIRALIAASGGTDVPVSLIGWCHYLLGRYDEAVRCLRAALAADEDDFTTSFDLALALLASGRTATAEVEYRRATERAKSRHRPPRQRGLFYIAIIDLIQAVKDRRIDGPDGSEIYRDLRQHLERARFDRGKLATLDYPLTTMQPTPLSV